MQGVIDINIAVQGVLDIAMQGVLDIAVHHVSPITLTDWHAAAPSRPHPAPISHISDQDPVMQQIKRALYGLASHTPKTTNTSSYTPSLCINHYCCCMIPGLL